MQVLRVVKDNVLGQLQKIVHNTEYGENDDTVRLFQKSFKSVNDTATITSM